MPSTTARSRRRSRRRALAFVAVGAALALACDGGERPELSPLAEEGRRVYLNVCIACHNADPSRDGLVAPANAGASLALLEAKILHGTYPPGYTPKRESQAMPRFEYLADDLDALHAFLQEAER